MNNKFIYLAERRNSDLSAHIGEKSIHNMQLDMLPYWYNLNPAKAVITFAYSSIDFTNPREIDYYDRLVYDVLPNVNDIPIGLAVKTISVNADISDVPNGIDVFDYYRQLALNSANSVADELMNNLIKLGHNCNMYDIQLSKLIKKYNGNSEYLVLYSARIIFKFN